MTNLKHIASLLLALLVFSIASVNATESITYIHTDHLGSPIAATNEDGSVKWTEDYQPFGVQRTNRDTDNTTGFTGHQHDDALELTYMQARWYHPEVGRFMALDPIVFRASDISSFGRYTYAANNPYYYVDPDGRANDRQIDLQNVRNFQGQQGVDTYNATFTTVNPEVAKSFVPGMGVVDGVESFSNGDYFNGTIDIVSELPLAKWLKVLKVTKKVDYSSIENPSNIGVGKNFTPRQKREALELNRAANGGQVKSDLSGTALVKPQKSKRGVTPDSNEWQFDHVKARSCGGTNCSSNLQILSRKENRDKSDN